MKGSCPDVAVLERFLEAGLDAEAEGSVSDHLRVCAECRDRVDALPGGTAWAERASGAGVDARAGRMPAPTALERIGEFRIIREIGRGGMGVVYEAEQTSLGRRVALKVMSAFGLLDRTLVGRFQREAHAAARLQHTNIVPVHGAGEERGLQYYAMEFIDGRGLDRIIRALRAEADGRSSSPAGTRALDASRALPTPAAGSLPYYRAVAELGIQAADGLAYAHAHGVIHRDIKPSNLLVDANSTLWIADFGLARSEGSDRLTRTGDVLGTVGYMAPERFRGISDERGDIYGLGVTLYELLTLRPAFQDEDRDALMRRVLDEDPPAPRRIDPLIPADLETVVLKAIEKDPERRYREASTLAADLRCFLLDRPIRARRATLVELAWRWCRRNRLAACMAAVTCALSIAAAVASWDSWTESTARRLAESRSRSEQAVWESWRRLETGQYEQALETISRALALHPSHEGRLVEARILFELGRLEDAAARLVALLEETPEDGAAHFLLASIYRGRDEQRSALHREAAERLLENTAEAFQLRAWTAETLNGALDWLHQALRLDPAHYSSLKSRALAYFALRDYEKMEFDARAAALKRPADPFNWYLMAISKASRRKLREALADLEQAIRLGGNQIEFLKQRRRIHRLLNEREAALEDARRIAALEPEDPTNTFHLAVALLAGGFVEEAKGLYADLARGGLRDRQGLGAALARQVFEDAAAGLDCDPPARDGSELIEGLHDHRRFYGAVSSKARRVATNAFKASWSPDGAKLVYDSVILRDLRLDAPAYPHQTGRRSVRVVDVDSGDERVVAENGKDAAWSPDGRWIVFVREPRFLDAANQEVFVVSPDGREERRLARGGYPTWSRDPSKVFFQSRELDMLCEIDVDDPGGKPRPLCPCAHLYPSVSPDGRSFSVVSGGELQIVGIASNAVEARWKPPLGIRGGLTEWSPDGREVSLGCLSFDDTGLWIFDRESRRARLFVRGPATLGTWSRDGRRFALTIRGKVLEVWVAGGERQAADSSPFPAGTSPEEELATLEGEAREAIGRRPDDPAAHRRRAEVLDAMERHAEAAAAYRAAYERSAPLVSDDLEAAARNLERAGNLAGAIEAMEEALRLPNWGPDALRRSHELRHRHLPRLVSYASIDRVLSALVVVPATRIRYSPGTTEPPPDWTAPGFDDSSWLAGRQSLGYGRERIDTRLDDMRGSYSTVYVRRRLPLPDPDRYVDYRLDVHTTGGFVAFLSGVEVGRWRAGRTGEAVRHDSLATGRAVSVDVRVINLPRGLLRQGRNDLALIGLSSHRDSADFFLQSLVRARWPAEKHPHEKSLDEFLALEDDADRTLGLRQEYLRARRLEREGRHREALVRLEAVIARDVASPEPYLATAACLRALGDFEGARRRLRAALDAGIDARQLWSEWWSLGVEAGADAGALLAEIPADAGGCRLDLRESLEALRESGELRINCGGGRYAGADGRVWLADRFWKGGFSTAGPVDPPGRPAPFGGEIAGTDDDLLYRTERWFSPDYTNTSRCAYLVPLPPGRYRVRLHFVETRERGAARCVFRVLIEHQPADERLDVFAEAGFARPVIREVTVQVRDGFLDVELLRIRGEPKVSAIEIHAER